MPDRSAPYGSETQIPYQSSRRHFVIFWAHRCYSAFAYFRSLWLARTSCNLRLTHSSLVSFLVLQSHISRLTLFGSTLNIGSHCRASRYPRYTDSTLFSADSVFFPNIAHSFCWNIHEDWLTATASEKMGVTFYCHNECRMDCIWNIFAVMFCHVLTIISSR